MSQNQASTYFHSKPFSRMEEFALLKAIRQWCRVIAKDVFPDRSGAPIGITIQTEKPVPEEVQEALGLVPIEGSKDPV